MKLMEKGNYRLKYGHKRIFFLPTALSQLSAEKIGDVVSFSPLSGSPVLLVCLVVLLLTCRLDYGDVFSELKV